MKLLLDTHVLVWAAIGDPKLPKGAARTGVDPAQLRGALMAVGHCFGSSQVVLAKRTASTNT